jgi:hypothetical protein
LGCPEFGFFGFAARFEDFVEYLNFPSQGIPFELLDDILAGLNGQISEQLPLDFFLLFGLPRSSAWITVKVSVGASVFRSAAGLVSCKI